MATDLFPTAKQVRERAVRMAIDGLLLACTPAQVAGLHRIHDASPWKGLVNCPDEELNDTYALVVRTLKANAKRSPNGDMHD